MMMKIIPLIPTFYFLKNTKTGEIEQVNFAFLNWDFCCFKREPNSKIGSLKTANSDTQKSNPKHDLKHDKNTDKLSVSNIENNVNQTEFDLEKLTLRAWNILGKQTVSESVLIQTKYLLSDRYDMQVLIAKFSDKKHPIEKEMLRKFLSIIEISWSE